MKIRNRARVRDALIVVVGVAGVGLIVGVTGKSAILAEIVDAVGFGLLLLLFMRFSGFPSSQPFIAIDEAGVRYGNRQFVPWEKVEEIASLRRGGRHNHLWVRTTGWKAKGFWGFWGGDTNRRSLPLSSLDPRRDMGAWLELVRRYAPPQVRLPSNENAG